MTVETKEHNKQAEDMSRIKLLLQRYETAKKHRDVWNPLWEECYDYALPRRA
jgi:hypothetical protein